MDLLYVSWADATKTARQETQPAFAVMGGAADFDERVTADFCRPRANKEANNATMRRRHHTMQMSPIHRYPTRQPSLNDLIYPNGRIFQN